MGYTVAEVSALTPVREAVEKLAVSLRVETSFFATHGTTELRAQTPRSD